MSMNRRTALIAPLAHRSGFQRSIRMRSERQRTRLQLFVVGRQLHQYGHAQRQSPTDQLLGHNLHNLREGNA